MAQPRSQQISLEATPYYHCISRCVRRAYLCGFDRFTNKSYEHRRDLIEKRLYLLADAFCIDLVAYAVLSNHYHLVLHINQEKALALSTDEVIERWHKLFKGTFHSQLHASGKTLNRSEKLILNRSVKIWRKRLYNVSWFMRCSNEPIARLANKEDGCKGKFFESRFISQALLDEAALLACSVYVDLNPIRAGIANTPEESDYTSIKQRINSCQKNEITKGLLPFAGNPREPMPMGIPCTAEDYFDLVDMTARQQRHGKTGFIDNTLSPLLQRLGISNKNWATASSEFETVFSTFVGQKHALANTCEVLSKKWINLQSHCCRVLST